MCQLSEELAKPTIENRSQNLQVMRNHSTKIAIENVIERLINPEEAAPDPAVERDASFLY